MNGLLLVDKPEGITSAGVIRALAAPLRRQKVGHLGTLDPFASGLLPLCVGEATKVARFLLLEQKTYEGTIQLGTTTDTLDPSGAVTAEAPVPPGWAEGLPEVTAAFTGALRQTPPMYSALKRQGVPLYALARRGEDVERQPRDVTIHSLALWASGEAAIDFRVTCSKGTYIRVLASEISSTLGTVGHLARLRRTAVGRFGLEGAFTLDALRQGDGPLPLLPLEDALADLPRHALSPEGLARLRHGQQAALDGLPAPGTMGAAAIVVDEAGRVAALLEGTDRGWRLARLLAP